jgi:hypothetical protein
MPINEAEGYALISSLTDKQQKEAMASVYGLGGNTMTPTMNQSDLSYEERIKLRRLLDSLDQKEAGGMKEFDLAKPPVPPYQYREFPFVMYHHQTRVSKPARNHEEREQMKAQGWSEAPFPAEGQQVELSGAELEESALIDRLLKMPKEEREALLAAARGETVQQAGPVMTNPAAAENAARTRSKKE